MRTFFARLLHIATGPVRPIRRWSILRFLLLALFWMLATLILSSVGLYLLEGPGSASFQDVVFWRGENLRSRDSLLRPLALLGGVVLGGIHYLVLRFLPFAERVPLASRERWITLSAWVALAIVPACQVKWWFRATQLRTTCGAWEISSKLATLESRGDYKGMVQTMEASCLAFQDAKAELGDWYVPVWTGGSGMSYLFVSLAAMSGEPYLLNAPSGLNYYLFGYEGDYEGTYGPPPKRCEPLACAMVESKVPIIRLTGLWWLGQHGTVAAEAKALVEGGDLSFLSWKDVKPYGCRVRSLEWDLLVTRKRIPMHIPDPLATMDIEVQVLRRLVIPAVRR